MNHRIGRRLAAAGILAAGILTGLTSPAGASVSGGIAVVAPYSSYYIESRSLDIAYNATTNEYLVLFATSYDFPALYSQRIDATSGAAIGVPVVVDAMPGASMAGPVALAWSPISGGCYLACYVEYGAETIGYARALDGSGAPSGAGRIALDVAGSGQYLPDVARDAAGFLAVWQHNAEAGNWIGDIRARRFLASGDAAGPSFAVDASPADSSYPSVAYLGGTVDAALVVYIDDAARAPMLDIKARRVAADNSVGAASILSTTPIHANLPVVAADDTDKEWGVAWQETDDAGWAGMESTVGHVAFRRVSSAGLPLGPVPTLIQGDGDIDVSPSIAWSALDNQYVVLWQKGAVVFDFTLPTPEIRGACLKGVDGSIVENDILVVADAGNTHDFFNPAVAARGGRDLMGVWISLSLMTGELEVEACPYQTVAPSTISPKPSPTPTPIVDPPGESSSQKSCLHSAAPAGPPAFLLAVTAIALLGLKRRA